MSQIYKDNYESLESLLSQAGSSEGATLLIPDLQRPYVWTPLQVTYLVDSLIRGWPFGSLLLWSVSQDDVAKMPSRQFSMVAAPDEGAVDEVPQKHAPATYRMVLDGQQRVQSLLLAFGGDGWGFKLEDRSWHNVIHNKRVRSRQKYKHWSKAELCVDLTALASEFEKTKSLAAIEFNKVLAWVIRDPKSGQSTWTRKGSYEEPLPKSFIVKGRYVRLSRLWLALATSSPSIGQLKSKSREILTEHAVPEALSGQVMEALMELIQRLVAVKSTRVTFLEVSGYTGEDMGKPEEYNDAIVSIFTRLNTAGRTLTREEITFAWIKQGWDSSRTSNKGASDCFRALAEDLKAEAKIDIDIDSLVGGVSLVWAVSYNKGRILSNADLLKGERIRPMSQEIALNWAKIRCTVLQVSNEVSHRGLQYGKHYLSFNSLAVLWAWRYIANTWGHENVKREVNLDAWAKYQNESLAKYSDRWLIVSQWADRWAGASSTTYLETMCKVLAEGSSEIQKLTESKEVDLYLGDVLSKLILSFAQEAINYITTLEVDARERVRAYNLPLWVWHRLEANRWSASAIPLRIRKKGGSLDVDHIVSVGLCQDYGFTTDIPDEDDLEAEKEDIDFGSVVDVNAIGNCWLLETNFNIAKNKHPASEFLKDVIEFRDKPEELEKWREKIGLDRVLFSPSKDQPQLVAQAIQTRTQTIREELRRFIVGDLNRVDLGEREFESEDSEPQVAPGEVAASK